MSSDGKIYPIEYPGMPEGVKELLSVAGLGAHFAKLQWYRGAKVAYTGMWHVSFAHRYYAGTTEHMKHGQSFESWVECVQKMCRKREIMKESGTWISP